MGSVSKPDALFDTFEAKNSSKTRHLHPIALDASLDRLSTGGWRMAVPLSLCRGISDDWHESDDSGYWRIVFRVPAYTKAVGLRALGIVERDSSDDDANAVLKYHTAASGFSKQLVFNQEQHGADPSVFEASLAWSRQWVSTLDTADPSSVDWISGPLAVTVSDEPQDFTIYLEAHSDLDFYVVAVQPYAIPYIDTAWPALP